MKKKLLSPLTSIISPNVSLIENNINYLPAIVGFFVFTHLFVYYLFILPLITYIAFFPVSLNDNLALYDFIFRILWLFFLYYVLDSIFYRIKDPKFGLQLDFRKILLKNYISGILSASLALLVAGIIYRFPVDLLRHDIIFSFMLPLEEVLVSMIILHKFLAQK